VALAAPQWLELDLGRDPANWANPTALGLDSGTALSEHIDGMNVGDPAGVCVEICCDLAG
jgi:hypothetical protein